MRIVRDMKITNKLNAILVILLLGFAGIGTAYYFVEADERQSTQTQAQVSRYRELIAQIDIRMLHALRQEKDFLLHNDAEYLDGHQAVMDQVYENIEELKTMDADSEEQAMIDELERLAQAYEHAFKAMVEAKLRLGLDENSGLLGELRNATHGVEDMVKREDMLGLANTMLMMRRHEKDFLARGADKYVERMQGEYQKFRQQLSSADIDPQSRAAIESMMMVYQKEFTAIVAATKQVEQQLELFHQAANAVEPALETLKMHIVARLDRVLTDLAVEKAWISKVMIGIMVSVAIISWLLMFLTSRMITRPLKAALAVVERIASGDLKHDIQVSSKDETGQMLQAMQTMQSKLTEVIGVIKNGTDEVSHAAQEISQGNTNLAQRTEEQAASLEETASSMEQMTATVKQNADNAQQANELAAGARDQAEKGGRVVDDAVSAMGEISSASKKIADIIGVIDEIAFQTNLLALNAAVEAARAGEQGRGFAVVASEVRNLAQRSATAAKEIKALIEDSVDKIEQGAQLVDRSGRTLEEIVGSVKRVSDIVAEIAAASFEQSSGIEQVNKVVVQMDDMTQQNAAMVQQAAVASDSMDGQAREMQGMMEFFSLRQGAAVRSLKKNTRSDADPGEVDFSLVRSKHLNWKYRLRRFLNGEESMTVDQAVSHKHCELGEWLYSEGIERYGHLQQMQQLEQVHERLHDAIRHIVELKQAGKTKQAEREFQQIESISQRVISLINVIEQQLKQESDRSQPPRQRSRRQVERGVAGAASASQNETEWEEF